MDRKELIERLLKRFENIIYFERQLYQQQKFYKNNIVENNCNFIFQADYKDKIYTYSLITSGETTTHTLIVDGKKIISSCKTAGIVSQDTLFFEEFFDKLLAQFDAQRTKKLPQEDAFNGLKNVEDLVSED